jgi:signal transduction histidine kinase
VPIAASPAGAADDAAPTASSDSISRRDILFWGVAGAGFVLAGLAFVLPWFSAWGKPGIADMVVFPEVGLSYLVAGVIAWRRRPENNVGLLMAAVGTAWLLYGVGWIVAPVPFAIANVSRFLYQAFLAHLALAFPSGRLRSRSERIIMACVYVWVPLSALLGWAFSDPRVQGCRLCPRNLLLIHWDPGLHHTVELITNRLSTILLVVVAVFLARHWLAIRKASRRTRRILAPISWVTLPAVALIGAQQAVNDSSLSGAAEVLVWRAGPLVLVGLPIAFLIGLLRLRLDRSAIADLMLELEGSHSQGNLRQVLARALHDPALALAYWVPDRGYVDERGHRFVLPRGGRSVTEIELGGQRVAAIVHDAALDEDPDLVRAAGAAVRLSLENERLQAEVRVQLEEVRASRARILEAGDAERQRVERNLHDGAQQRLLSLSLALRLALAQAKRSPVPDPELARTLEHAAEDVRRAMSELRELARGVHPAVLTRAGLGPAVHSLVETAPVPVLVVALPTERFPESVEAAAYFVVAEALANVGKYAAARRAEVDIHRVDGGLVVRVADDGVGGADPAAGTGLRGLEDRVAVLGGTVQVISPAGCGTTIVAEVPCG